MYKSEEERESEKWVVKREKERESRHCEHARTRAGSVIKSSPALQVSLSSCSAADGRSEGFIVNNLRRDLFSSCFSMRYILWKNDPVIDRYF